MQLARLAYPITCLFSMYVKKSDHRYTINCMVCSIESFIFVSNFFCCCICFCISFDIIEHEHGAREKNRYENPISMLLYIGISVLRVELLSFISIEWSVQATKLSHVPTLTIHFFVRFAFIHFPLE